MILQRGLGCVAQLVMVAQKYHFSDAAETLRSSSVDRYLGTLLEMELTSSILSDSYELIIIVEVVCAFFTELGSFWIVFCLGL